MTDGAPGRRPDARHDRAILRLAWPALGALVAEPLFLATDTALVGHLGAVPLAALGIAAAVLQTAVGLAIFLAYATTPVVGRRFGEGNAAGAVQAGVDGVWIAIAIGVALVAVGVPGSGPLVGAFGADAATSAAASEYLAVAVLGIPAMLIVLAATGLFRGLQDTRTPLWISAGGFAANAVLNAILIYPAGFGLIGSAIGTTIAQWGMALAALWVVARHARRVGAGLLPARAGVLASARLGGWLFLRTLSLRILLLGLTLASIPHGTMTIAAVQVTTTVLTLLAFALDALAIAGQAMIGAALGRGRPDEAREILRRLLVLAVGGGVVLGAALAALAVPVARVFTADPQLLSLIWPGLIVVAIGIPLGGAVYALDGVLIGAGDARFLALAGLVNLAATGPALIAIAIAPLPALAAVLLLQVAWSILSMLARAVPLGLRARRGRWLEAAV